MAGPDGGEIDTLEGVGRERPDFDPVPLVIAGDHSAGSVNAGETLIDSRIEGADREGCDNAFLVFQGNHLAVDTQKSLMEVTIPARTDLQAQYLEVNGLPQANLNALLEMLPSVRTPARVPELLEVSQELDYWFELALEENAGGRNIMPRLNQSINRILSTSPARQ